MLALGDDGTLLTGIRGIGVADPSTSEIVADPTSIVADGAATSSITVRLKDENTVPLTAGGDQVSITPTAGTLGGITDNQDGTYSATLTASSQVETATITATVPIDWLPVLGTLVLHLARNYTDGRGNVPSQLRPPSRTPDFNIT